MPNSISQLAAHGEIGPRHPPPAAVGTVGTVGTDQQGRVRRLDAAYTLPAQASAPPERVTVEMTLSDFGTPLP